MATDQMGQIKLQHMGRRFLYSLRVARKSAIVPFYFTFILILCLFSFTTAHDSHPKRLKLNPTTQLTAAPIAMAEEFEKTNLPWDLKIWQQRTGEWFETLTSDWKAPDLPENVPKSEIAPQTWEGLFWLIWIALGTLLVWKLYPTIARLIAEQTIPRIDLKPEPSAPILTQNQWLQQARSAKDQGDYAKAARALYFAALARLQERDLISGDRSLTNSEYRAQLRRKKNSSKSDRAYQTLANTHEALHYSQNTPISAQRYEDCDRAYRDIEQETP